MAIDSQAKRLSAIATRRLPWFRRFQPQPDGSIDQGDRQQLGYVYRGILVEEPAAARPRVISVTWGSTTYAVTWANNDQPAIVWGE